MPLSPGGPMPSGRQQQRPTRGRRDFLVRLAAVDTGLPAFTRAPPTVRRENAALHPTDVRPGDGPDQVQMRPVAGPSVTLTEG